MSCLDWENGNAIARHEIGHLLISAQHQATAARLTVERGSISVEPRWPENVTLDAILQFTLGPSCLGVSEEDEHLAALLEPNEAAREAARAKGAVIASDAALLSDEFCQRFLAVLDAHGGRMVMNLKPGGTQRVMQ